MQVYRAEANRTRLLARLVRELLAETPSFEDVGDLVEALKRRCARYRIGWTNDDIKGALRLVASNVPLPGAAAVERQRRNMAGRRPEPPQIGRAEAAAILLRLGVQLLRTWQRARAALLCGGCGRQLEAGDPVLVFEIMRGSRPPLRRVRCDRCEGPAPPELPPLVVHGGITPTPLHRLRPTLPLGMPLSDYRARASGEREPGEEG